MKEFIPVLKRTKLFAGVGEDDITAMLSCLGARLRTFKKGDYVLRQDEHLGDILVLAEGKLHIQRDDYWGNRSILGHIGIGEIFGEAYVAPESGTLLNDVVALEDSAVFFFDVKRVITTCSSACRFHTMVVQNLFFAISEKNRSLVQKLDYMSRRTTREKLLSYLSGFLIFPKRRRNRIVLTSRFRITGSSSRTTCLSTGAQCRMNCVRCVMKDFWSLRKIDLSCYKMDRRTP